MLGMDVALTASLEPARVSKKGTPGAGWLAHRGQGFIKRSDALGVFFPEYLSAVAWFSQDHGPQPRPAGLGTISRALPLSVLFATPGPALWPCPAFGLVWGPA